MNMATTARTFKRYHVLCNVLNFIFYILSDWYQVPIKVHNNSDRQVVKIGPKRNTYLLLNDELWYKHSIA